MVSIPAPARITSVSAVPARSVSAFTFLPRTIRMCGSTCRISAGSASALTSGSDDYRAPEVLESVDPDLLELVCY